MVTPTPGDDVDGAARSLGAGTQRGGSRREERSVAGPPRKTRVPGARGAS